MARPQVTHDGFLIPNANDVSNPRMAEPDRVDFNTLAHPLWGVVEGCVVTVTGTTAQTSGGTLLVNGTLVALSAGSIGLSVGTQDRFDLVVADSGGTLGVITGTPAVDPVFPDPPLNVTVLAAVFCPTGAVTLVDNVIDKRKFVNKALLTKIVPSADLIRNVNGSGNHYKVTGDGYTTWSTDTWMWRSTTETLSIHKNVALEGTLTAGGNVIAGGNIAATGKVTGSNLYFDAAAPGSAATGAIFSHAGNGRVYVWRSGAWQELATIQSANPVGTIIQSLELPTAMRALGWLPLNGDTVSEVNYPALFTVGGLAHLFTGTAPNRQMVLPNATKLMLVTDWDAKAGTKVSPNPANQVTLKTANMPRHGHNPRSSNAGSWNPSVTMGPSGQHTHVVSGGAHAHPVSDPGHAHNAMDFWGATAPIISVVYGGKNKIDALFNDRNHTYSVEPLYWIKHALTGITIGSSGSDHVHNVVASGEHTHTATVSGAPDHVHGVLEDQVGGDQAFSITPEYLTVYSYVRS